MAAGWPTKVTYANGDLFNASDINDTNGTLNYINPTSATDNQVLTRDAAASGKVKWANSPANTLTTKGDLYYASAANTPARLGIGTTDQILAVSASGVPAWTTGGGGMTLLASTTSLGSVNTYTFSSISQSYTRLYIRLVKIGSSASAEQLQLRINGVTATNCYLYSYNTSSTSAPVVGGSTALPISNGAVGTFATDGGITIHDYTSTAVAAKAVNWSVGNLNTSSSASAMTGIGVIAGTTANGYEGCGAVNSITFLTAAGSNFASTSAIYLYGEK